MMLKTDPEKAAVDPAGAPEAPAVRSADQLEKERVVGKSL
jgi:hypothetical protein